MAKKKKQAYHESAKKASEILQLIRSKQEARNVYELLKKEESLPTVAETLSSAQNKRLHPLAWLINNQKYTVQEILNVALSWGNHENSKEAK